MLTGFIYLLTPFSGSSKLKLFYEQNSIHLGQFSPNIKQDHAEFPEKQGKPRILLAPLDWGLGHATRCLPPDP